MIETVIFLGNQELSFCDNPESLANDPSVNTRSFLKTLKYLTNCDDVITTNLEEVENDNREMEEKKKGSKKGDKTCRFGRGSKLTFMSNDIQNKLINIISKEIGLEMSI